jgi:hypothetical protein
MMAENKESSLLLPDEGGSSILNPCDKDKIGDGLKGCYNKNGISCAECRQKTLLQAELDHLAKPEFNIYVKEEHYCRYCICGWEDQFTKCDSCKGTGKIITYIPLADYLKGEKKE